MAEGNFEACHKVTLKYEGGYANNPNDPGGRTNFGITEKVYHAWLLKRKMPIGPVKNITPKEVHDIYYEQYWLPISGDHLFVGVDLATYDFGVNSGPSRAVKYLGRVVGSNDHSITVRKLCAARLSFMRALGTWKHFGKGWTSRVAGIEALGVSWALKAMGLNTQQVKDRMLKDSKAANRTATNQTATATTSGATSTASGTGYAIAPDPDQLAGYALSAIFIIGIIVCGFFIYKSYVNRKRAMAYAEVAVTHE